MANSGVYFIHQVDKSNNGNTTCNCFVLKNGSSVNFILTNKGFGNYILKNGKE